MTLDQLYAAAQQHVLSRNNPTSPVDVANILLNYIAENGGSVDGTAINPSSIGATTRGTVTATNGNFQQTGGDGITVFVVKAGANNSAGGNPYMFEVRQFDNTFAFGVSPLGAFCNGSLSFGDSNFDYPVSKIMRNSNNALNFVVFNAVDNVGHGAFNFELGGTHYAPTSGVGAYVWYGENSGAYGFTPASGTAVHNGLWVNWTINQTGGANGISRGIYVNPTLTAAADFRGIEVADVGSSHFAIKTGTGKVEFGGPVQSLYQRYGSGTPEAAVTAPVGAVYHRTDGGAGTSFYVKESGTGNTGWVAK